jgi:two-component system, NarL family, sensor kinase
MKYCIAFFACFFCAVFALSAQTVSGGATQPAASYAADTATVNRLNAAAAKLQFSDPLQAISTLQQAIILSNKINYPFGLSVAYSLRAGLLFYEMKLDSCRLLLDKAYAAVKNNTDQASQIQVGNILNRYAAIYQRRQDYSAAVEHYLQAMNIFTATGDELKIINSYYNLSGIYKYLNDTAKMFFYAAETNRLAAKTTDSSLIIRGLITLGDAYNFTKKYDSLLLVSKKGLALATRQGITFATGIFNNFTGLYYANKALRYDSAVYYYTAALQSFTNINTQYDIALVLQNLGQVYLKMNDNAHAVQFLQQAQTLSRQLNFEDVLTASLLGLVTAEERNGNIAASNRYLKQYVQLNDSVQNRNSRKKVFELEAKYQAQKKEVELAAQRKMIQQKSTLNYLLAGSTLLLLIVFTLLYSNHRHKQKLQQQRIADLETQQQLLAAAAVLKGEEQERTRIAKDLHDGLGGMLSGIKFTFSTMKGNMVLTPENGQALERSIDMLDSSIKEMRRVAHNMMPEALLKFGLDTALNDFCSSINQTGALHIQYQSIGMDNSTVVQTVAISLYRIVQELVNNTLKHAGAKTAIVQLSKSGSHLSLTVEDDGRGFDTALLHTAGGIGWSNIKSRVDFLKGTLDVRSAPEKGTSVHIEINT